MTMTAREVAAEVCNQKNEQINSYTPLDPNCSRECLAWKLNRTGFTGGMDRVERRKVIALAQRREIDMIGNAVVTGDNNVAFANYRKVTCHRLTASTSAPSWPR
jgi:hypothetical protein